MHALQYDQNFDIQYCKFQCTDHKHTPCLYLCKQTIMIGLQNSSPWTNSGQSIKSSTSRYYIVKQQNLQPLRLNATQSNTHNSRNTHSSRKKHSSRNTYSSRIKYNSRNTYSSHNLYNAHNSHYSRNAINAMRLRFHERWYIEAFQRYTSMKIASNCKIAFFVEYVFEPNLLIMCTLCTVAQHIMCPKLNHFSHIVTRRNFTNTQFKMLCLSRKNIFEIHIYKGQ